MDVDVIFPIILLLVLFLFIPIYISINRYKFKQGIKFIENELLQVNFNISHKIGHFHIFSGSASFYLYSDDVNKKWVIASPMDKKLRIGEIRGYDDLIAFDFFDEDSNTWVDKMAKFIDKHLKGPEKMMMSALGVLVGYAVGDLLGGWKGGIISAIGGGLGFAKLADLMNGMPKSSVSGAYGLVLKTTDSVTEEGVLLFNFLMMPGKVAFKWVPRLHRNTGIFKKDIKTISKMREMLEYIHNSK